MAHKKGWGRGLTRRGGVGGLLEGVGGLLEGVE